MYTKILVEQDYLDLPEIVKKGVCLSLDDMGTVTVYPVRVTPDEILEALNTFEVMLKTQKK